MPAEREYLPKTPELLTGMQMAIPPYVRQPPVKITQLKILYTRIWNTACSTMNFKY